MAESRTVVSSSVVTGSGPMGAQYTDYDGEYYTFLEVTDAGMDWLVANQDKLTLRNHGRRTLQPIVEPEDDLPF